MYDLQSLKLTEAEAKLKKVERNLHTAQSELKSETGKKSQLEKQLEKEKHEHHQKTMTLKLETEQRDKREKELRDVGQKFNSADHEKQECIAKLDKIEKQFKVIQDEHRAQALSIKSFEESAVECQRQQSTLNSEIEKLKKEKSEISSNSDHSDELRHEMEQKQNQLQEEVEENKQKYHQNAEELNELKDALIHMGVEGLKRDHSWEEKLSEEQRSIILQGIMDTDVIPDVLLNAEPTPENPPENPAPAENQEIQIPVPIEKVENVESPEKLNSEENNIQPPEVVAVDPALAENQENGEEKPFPDNQPDETKVESPDAAGERIKNKNSENNEM